MIDKLGFDQLDKLLESPALIADRGFSEGVQNRISGTRKPRSIVFVALGCAWLALAALNWSPGFIDTSLQSLLDIAAWIGGQVIQASSLSGESAGSTVSGLPPLALALLLPVLGLSIFQFMDGLGI